MVEKNQEMRYSEIYYTFRKFPFPRLTIAVHGTTRSRFGTVCGSFHAAGTARLSGPSQTSPRRPRGGVRGLAVTVSRGSLSETGNLRFRPDPRDESLRANRPLTDVPDRWLDWRRVGPVLCTFRAPGLTRRVCGSTTSWAPPPGRRWGRGSESACPIRPVQALTLPFPKHALKGTGLLPSPHVYILLPLPRLPWPLLPQWTCPYFCEFLEYKRCSFDTSVTAFGTVRYLKWEELSTLLTWRPLAVPQTCPAHSHLRALVFCSCCLAGS